MKPGAVLAYSGDSKTALFAWLLGGILTLAGGLTIAEIGTQIPKPAGFIRTLKKCTASFGDFVRLGADYHLRSGDYWRTGFIFWIFNGESFRLGIWPIKSNRNYSSSLFMRH